MPHKDAFVPPKTAGLRSGGHSSPCLKAWGFLPWLRKTWGYHLELEVLIGSLKEKAPAEKKIERVAAALGVKTMSEKELWEFTQRIEKSYVNPKNSRKIAIICPKPIN
jgi:hypothetical protein